MTVMPEKTLLDVRVHEVVRVLPPQQKVEVLRYDASLHDAVLHLEYGKYNVPLDPWDRSGKSRRAYLDRVAPRIATTMAWADLQLAEAADFPAPNPRLAMRLGCIATETAAEIAGVIREEPEVFYPLSQNLVGLHAALLGAEHLLSSESGTSNFQLAVQDMQAEVVRPLFERYAGYQRSLRY